MKYKITVVLECENAPTDQGADHPYIASIVASTAADGAKKHLDKSRNAKIIEASAEYTHCVKADILQ